jgi:hypothetical protein
VDFSDAQRKGFILALADYWEGIPGNVKTRDELEGLAESLLKGCHQHFRRQVDRVSKISAVVSPPLKDAFTNMCLKLAHTTDETEFQKSALYLNNEFPLARPWLAWWLRSEHAQEVFPACARMSEELWHSLPDTTNAGESIHNQLMQICKSNHTLVDGLYAVNVFASQFSTKTAAELGE